MKKLNQKNRDNIAIFVTLLFVIIGSAIIYATVHYINKESKPQFKIYTTECVNEAFPLERTCYYDETTLAKDLVACQKRLETNPEYSWTNITRCDYKEVGELDIPLEDGWTLTLQGINLREDELNYRCECSDGDYKCGQGYRLTEVFNGFSNKSYMACYPGKVINCLTLPYCGDRNYIGKSKEPTKECKAWKCGDYVVLKK